MHLDRKSPFPLYAQLKEILEDKILSKEWKPNTQIPTEDQLCADYDISRITVRQALAGLEHDGLVTRQPGSGTFVNEQPIKLDLGPLTGFTQDMLQKNKKPGAEVIEFNKVLASTIIAERLGISPDTEVFKLARLRNADGEPLAVETAYIHCQACPDLIQHDLSNQSLYQLFTSKYDLIPSRAIQQVQAIPCPPEYASLLEIPPGSPALRMYRRTDDQYGNPLEWVVSIYRGDKYILEVELRND